MGEVFERCTFSYSHLMVEVEDPQVAAAKLLNEVDMEGEKPAKIAQNGTNMCIFKSDEEEEGDQTEQICHSKLLILLKIGIIFMSLHFFFNLEYLIPELNL